MSKLLKQIPKFASEAEERAFWETNDSADYVDWTKAKRDVLPTSLEPNAAHEPALMAEPALAQDWLNPEEDAKWVPLQPDK